MKNLLKIFSFLLIAISESALLLAINSESTYRENVVYDFALILFYGWFLYIPFMILCSVILSKINSISGASAFSIGALLALLLDGLIVQTTFQIVYSGSKIIDLLCFSISGGIYLLLFNKYIHIKRARFLRVKGE
jgi:hypothetical protein